MNSHAPGNEKQNVARDWVDAARKILIKRGIGKVSLRGLAKSLNATTGAFYWKYKNLDALLDELRMDWASRNTDPFTRAIASAGSDGWKQFLCYTRVVVLEDEFDPRYDNAIRDWAHSSKRTADVLRDVEQSRIEQLCEVFRAMGFDRKAASIRARVTYYHQTGYHAMRIDESLQERLENIPYFAEILTDRSDLFDDSNLEMFKQQVLGLTHSTSVEPL